MDALLKGLAVDYLAACDFAKTGKTWQVFLPAASLVKAAQRLLAADYFLEDICALDCAEGYVVTYHFAHFEKPGRTALRVVLTLPMVLPPTVLGFYLLMCMSPQGFLGKLAESLFGVRIVFSFTGMLMASLVFSVPFMLNP